MSNVLPLSLALLAGALLGVVFFGALWWTVQKGVASDKSAYWFLGSLFLRMGMILVGFYFVSQGDWARLGMCLLGFLLARILVVRWLSIPKETSYAP